MTAAPHDARQTLRESTTCLVSRSQASFLPPFLYINMDSRKWSTTTRDYCMCHALFDKH